MYNIQMGIVDHRLEIRSGISLGLKGDIVQIHRRGKSEFRRYRLEDLPDVSCFDQTTSEDSLPPCDFV